MTTNWTLTIDCADPALVARFWCTALGYVESDPPMPGEPDIIKRTRITHSNCLPPPGPDPGELFKSLPAYKKLHPP